MEEGTEDVAASQAPGAAVACMDGQDSEIRELEVQLASLKKEEQALTQKAWKATKRERKLLDAKVLSLQARIKGHTKKIDKALAVSDSSQTTEFEQRLRAREHGRFDEDLVADEEAQEDSSRIHLRGRSLVFLEIDGIVAALVGGLQDELLRRLREMVRAADAELVVISEWRRDARLLRMLDAALSKLDMPKISHTTRPMTLQEQQEHGVSGDDARAHTRVYEIRKFLRRCSIASGDRQSVCPWPWVVLDTADLTSGEWLTRQQPAPVIAAASSNASRNSARHTARTEGDEKQDRKRQDEAAPIDNMHFVRVEGSRGLSPEAATRALNCLRFQTVSLVRTNNQSLCLRGPEDAALAFAMATHHRLGGSSPANCLRRDMTEFLRSREGGLGRRGGTEALRAILCKHVAVPGDFASVEEAIARGGAENHLTLHITLGEGTHVLSDTIRPPRGCRIVIRSALLGTGTGSAARGSGSGGISGGKSKIAASLANSLAARGIKVEAANAKGEATQVGAVSSVGGGMDAIGIEEKVRLVVYGGACLVSVQDQDFLANPFCVGSHPAMAQAHITLEGITLEAHVLDRDKFVRDYTDQLYQEFKMKETRGLYRRMLIEKGIFKTAEEAEGHCGTLEAARDMLANHALEAEVSRLSRDQPRQGGSTAYLHSAPRLIESLEGGVVLRRCVLKSEVSTALYCARTGVIVCQDCRIIDCRGSGIVVGKGGTVELHGGELSSCRGYGAVALGGCKLKVTPGEKGGAKIGNNAATGLSAHEGGLVDVLGATISGNGECGVSAQLGSTVALKDCSISANGSGVAAQEHSTAELVNTEIARNKTFGVSVTLTSTTCISGCKIVRNGGNGLTVLKGAEAVVGATTLSGNAGAGVLTSEDANTTITNSEMRSNEQHGMVAQKGACITARACLLLSNLGAGALAALPKSRVGMIGGEVKGNRIGLVATDHGIVAEAEGCEISDNTEAPEVAKTDGQVLHPVARPPSVVAVGRAGKEHL